MLPGNLVPGAASRQQTTEDTRQFGQGSARQSLWYRLRTDVPVDFLLAYVVAPFVADRVADLGRP